MTLLRFFFVFSIITFCVTDVLNSEKAILEKWKYWKKLYNKQYNQTEEPSKFKIWYKNFKMIQKRNLNISNGNGFTLAMNQFGDVNYNIKNYFKVPSFNFTLDMHITKIKNDPPASWDWREKGVVDPVVNQGVLGNSYIFAVTDAVVSYHAIQNGTLIELSYDELSDCCPDIGNIWKCITKLNGLCGLESYITKPDHQCNNKSCIPVAQIKGHKTVSKGDEKSLLLAVLINPVVAIIDASQESFMFYSEGIYYEPHCQTKLLNHAILIIGYGSLNGQDFWICKNSWGISWGMKGYILMSRNRNNNCGIATFANYPL